MRSVDARIGPAVLLLGLLFLSSTAIAQTTHIVTVADNFFSPSSLTIQAGDTVEWRNAAGGNPHNVTANDGSFASTTASSFTYSRTFTTAGTFDYSCTVHSGMDGVIIVLDAVQQAELVLREVSVAAGNYPQGSTISIDAEVDNTGNAASGPFTISHYASLNNSISAQDILLGTENRSSLPAGENSSGPFAATIPVDLAPGAYFIGSIVNFSDSDSGNNANVEESPVNVTAVSSFQINAGLNDAWYNRATSGQGLLITVFPDREQIFLAWFTYDTERPPEDVTAILGEPGHRWLTAQGPYDGDTANLTLVMSSGGVFDAAEPAVSRDTDYGSMRIEFADCTDALVTYEVPSLNIAGTFPIERIALDNVPLCEALLAQ